MPIRHIATLRDGSSEEERLKVIDTPGLPAWAADADFTVVGKPHTRLEGADKVTGRAQYSYDMQLPGQLYARVLRSPYPHARVASIDTSKAEALPGVHAILTLANTPEMEWYEEKVKLFESTVRFVGDEVAAVAAESEEIAEDALRLIQVTYSPLPFVTDMEKALQSDAPLIHPHNERGNRAGEPKTYERGDVEAGLREADVVIDQHYRTETALHNSLEPHGCTAHWHGNQLTLWESTQGIFEVREMVAERVGLPEHQVRVIKHHMGGGFGAKQIAWKQSVIAALLSKRSGHPVQLMLDREAENLAAGNRNATIQHVKLGAKRDGTLTAIYTESYQAVGAYRVGGEGSNVSGPYERLYRCPNVYTKQEGVYINAGPAVAFRAPGFVEGAFALESAMDELAVALNMDPLELRLKNYAEEDQKKELPYGTPDALRACYEAAAKAFGWQEARRQRENRQQESGSKRRGIGIAAHDWGGAGHPPGYAWVKLNDKVVRFGCEIFPRGFQDHMLADAHRLVEFLPRMRPIFLAQNGKLRLRNGVNTAEEPKPFLNLAANGFASFARFDVGFDNDAILPVNGLVKIVKACSLKYRAATARLTGVAVLLIAATIKAVE